MSSHSLIVARAVSLGAPCHNAWPRARDKWPREKEEIHQTTCRAIILPVMQRRRQPATKNLTTKCLRCIAQIVLGNFRWAEHQRATEGEWWVSTAEYTYICIWCDDDEARAWDPQARHHTRTHTCGYVVVLAAMKTDWVVGLCVCDRHTTHEWWCNKQRFLGIDGRLGAIPTSPHGEHVCAHCERFLTLSI